MDIYRYKKTVMPISIILQITYVIVAFLYFEFGILNIVIVAVLGTITAILSSLPKTHGRLMIRTCIFIITIVAFLIIATVKEFQYLDNTVLCRWVLLLLLIMPNLIYTQCLVIGEIQKPRSDQ